MILNEIEINSYRSILKQKIQIKEKCIGFIGLNESGKTNIINAIRFIEKSYTSSFKDKSKNSDKFPEIRYNFVFDENEYTELTNNLNNQIKDLFVIPDLIIMKEVKLNNFNVISKLTAVQNKSK